MEMSQKYKSDIITIHPFPVPYPFVVLNSYESIREAMLSPETAEVVSGRPLKVFDSALNPNRYGKIPQSVFIFMESEIIFKNK